MATKARHQNLVLKISPGCFFLPGPGKGQRSHEYADNPGNPQEFFSQDKRSISQDQGHAGGEEDMMLVPDTEKPGSKPAHKQSSGQGRQHSPRKRSECPVKVQIRPFQHHSGDHRKDHHGCSVVEQGFAFMDLCSLPAM